MKDLIRMEKVVWAIDPSEKDPDPKEKIRQYLSFLQNGVEALVAKECVIRPASAAAEADQLNLSARDFSADILVTTGFSQGLLTDSIHPEFLEALISKSSVPILVIDTHAKVGTGIKTIFFPTELDSHSKGVFRLVISLAKKIGASVKAVHVAVPPEEHVEGLNFDPRDRPFDYRGQTRLPREAFNLHVESLKRHGEMWRKWAAHQGVAASFEVIISSSAISETLCAKANSAEIDLVVLATKRGAFGAVVFGSMARKMIRKAATPTLLLTPMFLSENEKELQRTGMNEEVNNEDIDANAIVGLLNDPIPNHEGFENEK